MIERPTSCKFCSSTVRSINGYRDGIEFECGASFLYHSPPHGAGWSWWGQPPSCKIIVALKGELGQRDIEIDWLKTAVREMKEEARDAAWEAWGHDN